MLATVLPPPKLPRGGSSRGTGNVNGNAGGGGSRKTINTVRAPLNIPATPPKILRAPPRKGNKRETLQDIARRVPVELIRPYFNYPLRAAADALCISVTTLKRLCRRHGVKRWPHRQLSGLNRAVSHLEAKQRTSGDPVIADQLRQLYSRRDVVIDLAFMSDDEHSDANPSWDHSNLKSEGGDEFSMPATPTQAIEEYHGSSSAQDAMIPWWHRDPGTSPWQRGGTGGDGGDGGVYSTSDGGMGIGGVGSGRHDGRNCGGAMRPDVNREELGVGGGGAGGWGNFRASSVLVRLPGMSPPPPESSLRPPSQQGIPTGFNLPQAQGHGTSVATANSLIGPGREAPCWNLSSPMSIGRTVRPPMASVTPIMGESTRYPSTHFLPLPSHHPSDSIERQITELAALDDILFAPEGEEPNLQYARAAAVAAGGSTILDRPRGVGVGSLESSAIRLSPSQYYATGNGNDLREKENGRLPSIAGLVAAGDFLNGGDFRSCRTPNNVCNGGHAGGL